jgi:hypothetical protein
MYRIIVIIFILCLLHLTIQAQQKVREAGFFAGTSYYMGDINLSRIFYKPAPSFGALFKYRLNDRHCLRLHGIYGKFQGSDRDFDNEYQLQRAASFSLATLDLDAIYEFNFMPFMYDARKTSFSPFLFGGLGYELILQSEGNTGNHFVLPFGAGIKYLLNRTTTIGLEWSFRKTFTDKADGVENPGKPSDKSVISHGDWYSFAGFFITFRLFDHSCDCPVYK